MSMTERMIVRNGKMLFESQAVMSVYDSALMYGDMCFEMTRTFNKKTFMLDRHIDRLDASCNALEIEINKKLIKIDHEGLLAWHIENFSDEEEWRTLINVSRGILPLYQGMLGNVGGINIIITCFPLRHILKGKSYLYGRGVHAVVPSQRAIPQHYLDPKLKTRSRQHLMVANLQAAKVDPDAWPLLLDDNGYITEFTGANIFMVKDRKVYTPKGINCLRGISRQYVIMDKILLNETYETDLTLYDLMTADEAFATCTPYSIVPVTRLNGRPVGDGNIGKVTERVMRGWGVNVDCDFRRQAERWDDDRH